MDCCDLDGPLSFLPSSLPLVGISILTSTIHQGVQVPSQQATLNRHSNYQAHNLLRANIRIDDLALRKQVINVVRDKQYATRLWEKDFSAQMEVPAGPLHLSLIPHPPSSLSQYVYVCVSVHVSLNTTAWSCCF